MTILGPDIPLPALRRGLEAVPGEEKGQPIFMLRDLEDITAQVVALSPGGMALASCLDGKRTAKEISALFAQHTGHILKTEEISALVQDLERALLLETPETAQKRLDLLRAFKESPVRKALSAGRAYPGEVLELAKMLGRYFQDPKGPGKGPASEPSQAPAVGLIAPHIDFERGGPVYAWSYGALSECRPPDAVVALGVAHMAPDSPWVMTPKAYETPYGPAALHQGLYDDIRKALWYDPRDDEWVHRNEHSLELQALWLRYLWRDKTPPWVPILCSSFERFCPDRPPSTVPTMEGAIVKIAEVLAARAKRGEHVMVLAGVDLAHVGPRFGDEKEVTPELRKTVEAEDRQALEHALRLDADDFYMSVVKGGNPRKVCGLSALYTALRLISALADVAPAKGELLSYSQADDPAGGTVSFAGAIFRA